MENSRSKYTLRSECMEGLKGGGVEPITEKIPAASCRKKKEYSKAERNTGSQLYLGEKGKH